MQARKRFLPAGWYPMGAAECRRQILGFRDYIEPRHLNLTAPKGGIVPHAGWFFSGRLAALVLHHVAAVEKPDLVAVCGGHLGGGPGIVYADSEWETPMGGIPVDEDFTEALASRFDLKPAGAATNDNTVEVQMPLVRHYFPDSRLVALRVPHSPQAVVIGTGLAELAREQGKTLVCIGSTDLTHYGPNYGFMPKGSGSVALDWVRKTNDRGFIDAALAMDLETMLDHAERNHSACSAGGAAAAAAACRALGARRGYLADYYTSHDIMPGDSYVGYAGIVYGD